MSKSIYNTYDTTVNTKSPSIEGVAVSSTTTYYSEPIAGAHSEGFSLHLRWTGDPTGTFSFWVSNKPTPSLTDDTDWVQDSTAYTAANPAGSASKAQHNIAQRAKWKRMKYVNASGSGSIFGWVNVPRNS